jgi:hypothetical protein
MVTFSTYFILKKSKDNFNIPKEIKTISKASRRAKDGLR